MPDRRGPIFIVGAMGSGTTLLRLMLDSHPRIAIPQETGFMRAYKAQRTIPFKWRGGGWGRRLGWTREEFDEVMREVYDRLFMRYAEQHGKVRWGEKTPYHTWHIDDMARVFPDAVFLGIVRHPGASVASNVSRSWRDPGWGRPSRTIEHYWRNNREIARQATRHPDRFAVLRYEDLLLHTEPLMRELLDWLGEPWSDDVLRHHTVQAQRGGETEVEGQTRVDDPIDVSRIAKWTQTLDPAVRRRMERRLARIGELWGYDVTDPMALAPLGDGSMLLGGADVARRVEDFPDLEIDKPSDVPLPDRRYHPNEVKLVEREALPERGTVPEPPPSPPEPKPKPKKKPAPPKQKARMPGPAERALAPLARRLPKRGRERLIRLRGRLLAGRDGAAPPRS